MAATEHYRAAASALANARQEKQREIDDLRHRLSQQEVDVKHSVQQMNTQMRTLEASISRTAATDNNQASGQDRSRLMQSVAQIRRTIGGTESDFGRQRQQMHDHIRLLEQEVMRLDVQIREFEMKR